MSPTLGIVDRTTLAFEHVIHGATGGSDWDLNYVRQWPLSGSGRVFLWKPHGTAISSGIYAVDKNYFFELGGYDTKLTRWETASIEMSFRTWMCGGKLQVDPCSVVYRALRGPNAEHTTEQSEVNDYDSKARVALTWLDDFVDGYFNGYVKKLDQECLRTEIGWIVVHTVWLLR